MPTTLITNMEANGVGVLGTRLAGGISGITKIIAIRCQSGMPDIVPPGSRQIVAARLPVDGNVLDRADNDAFLYIESSCGLARTARERGRRVLFVPMWEQGVWDELPYASTVVAVTRHTQAYFREKHGADSIYLPWPMDVPPTYRAVGSVRTVLHNAGSLGGNLRKGTLEAIRIFQRSGVATHGVRLLVHAWRPMTPEIETAIVDAPDGIEWDNRFVPELDDIYRGADLLLMPSKIDGSPLIACEAMARGIPALVTDAAPINECEADPDFRIPVKGFAESPLMAPYAVVNVEAGAERLARICERDLSGKSREVRSLIEREHSWAALGPTWDALCA